MNEDVRTIDTIYADERIVYQKLDENETKLSDLVRYEETLLSSYGSALSHAKHLLNTSSSLSVHTFYEELVRQMEGTYYQIEETLIDQKNSLQKVQNSLEEKLDVLQQEKSYTLAKEK